MSKDILFQPLDLPNGTRLPNRLAKAAMEENLADPGQIPGSRLERLYERWAQGGAGLLITGNVMIDPSALTGPGGVVLEADSDIAPFAKWAEAARSNGAQVWMQINHPGRQVYADMREEAVSPSDVAVAIPGFSALFGKPRALTADEIPALVTRFADAAAKAEEAGFTGVQIHAAHGYLISQFLSPLTNTRTDDWGGPLENRARFLFDVIAAVRARVAPDFCVTFKLNSADFQKGGFGIDDAKWVVQQVNTMQIDLVELSGGNYETPAMQGISDDASSTLRREAYFIDFARDIASVAQMPIMVTGGITRRATAIEALMKDEAGFGVSVLGLARALAFNPDLPNDWKANRNLDVTIPQIDWKIRTLSSLATMATAKAQIERMAKGRPPKPGLSPILALLDERRNAFTRTRRYRRWRQTSR
ncbi:NADH:flavin oxidoreductase/NADH oxidase family protein [Aestuariibius insulae]|uniref:NADH:flavin oxidoreductase/NADH oxidase family protein n=1 Tax=Aestuariibius insulae TaxID=2058287 RepID=UPI00345E8A83